MESVSPDSAGVEQFPEPDFGGGILSPDPGHIQLPLFFRQDICHALAALRPSSVSLINVFSSDGYPGRSLKEISVKQVRPVEVKS